jgi:hypothetical protein
MQPIKTGDVVRRVVLLLLICVVVVMEVTAVEVAVAVPPQRIR